MSGKGGLVVEYAKSGRSACKSCSKEVAKGEMRFGVISKGQGGFDMTRWHHSKCFFQGDFHIPEPAKLKGFETLKVADQSLIKEFALGGERSAKRRKEDDAVSTISAGNYDANHMEKILNDYSPSQLAGKYKDADLPNGWKAFSSVIIGGADGKQDSEKIAGFDFDGCLVNTSVKRVGADAWSLQYPSIPEKLLAYHNEGYKLVIFTNEANIERWTKSRQKAVDSKLGRLKGFLELVKVPMLVIVSCGTNGSGDIFRKPCPGMWELMSRHLNSGIAINKDKSFYVGDAAGRDGDHSDADVGFAKAVGVKFFVPEEVFLE